MKEPEVSPFAAGLKGRCLRCGVGRLFAGFLRVAPRCDRCGLGFAGQDSGDGAAAFIILIAGFAILIPALVVEVKYGWPVWLHMVVWLPLTVLLCLALLRPFKATLIALQYRHRRQEFDET